MNSLFKLPALAFGLLLFIATTQNAKAQYDDVSLQTFYDELSPYGTWINDPEYGYVWRPDVDQGDFRPYYTNGRWAMTEYGNTWVSNYEWGWAPFHYGRWIYNRYNNWVWIPDTVWGPAWVNWRSGGGYYGWAPMPPRIGVHVNLGIADFWWNFVPYNNIYVSSFPRYYSGRNRVYVQNTVIINNTYVRNNRTYYTGPRADDIRRHTNQRVTIYNIERTSRNSGNRINNDRVSIYSPRPTRNGNNTVVAPKNSVNARIDRDRIERNGEVKRDVVNANRSNVREHRTGDVGRIGERNNTDRSNNANTQNERPTRPQENNRQNGLFGRNRDRSEAGAVNGTPSREMSVPQRDVNLPRETNNNARTSRNSGLGNRGSSTENRAPQRFERPQVQRAERPSNSSNRSGATNNGNSSNRGSRGESGGRPGRG